MFQTILLALLPLLPTFDKGPYLQNVGGTYATILWQSSEGGAAIVTARPVTGGGPAMQIAVNGPAATGIYEVVLAGLRPDTAYRYDVTQHRERREGRFVTAAPPGRPFTAVIYGDNRSDHAAHNAVAQAMLKEGPDLIVHTGDLVVHGNDEGEWDLFFRVAGPLLRGRPIFPVAGNHEASGDPRIEQFRRYFSLPAENDEFYYGFSWGGVRFLSIDVNVNSAGGQPDERQAAWLTAEVKAAEVDPTITHTVAFLHQGPYSTNPNRRGNLGVRQLAELLRGLGLDLLVSGHDHYYERGVTDYGMPYMVVGSGGAPLYPTTGPGRYPGFRALVSRSVHAFVRLRSNGRALTSCALDLDGVAFDCADIVGRAVGRGR